MGLLNNFPLVLLKVRNCETHCRIFLSAFPRPSLPTGGAAGPEVIMTSHSPEGTTRKGAAQSTMMWRILPQSSGYFRPTQSSDKLIAQPKCPHPDTVWGLEPNQEIRRRARARAPVSERERETPFRRADGQT